MQLPHLRLETAILMFEYLVVGPGGIAVILQFEPLRVRAGTGGGLEQELLLLGIGVELLVLLHFQPQQADLLEVAPALATLSNLS